jgi:hypothetical protein
MKRWPCLAVTVALLFLLAGCEPQVSLFPLFDRNDTLFDKRLLGTWQIWGGTNPDTTKTPGVIVFAQSSLTNTYDVKIPDFDQETHSTLSTQARLVPLGKYVFIDLATPENDKLPLIPFPTVAAHAFGRVTLEGDHARIDLLNDEWTKNAVKAGKMPLVFQDASTIVISASTADLRKFALEHAEDHAAFSESFTLLRKDSPK